MERDLFDLSGHVAVVTGGNGGIGLGMARGLARAGARVALWGRDAEKNRRAAEQLERAGSEVAAFVADVSREEDVVAQTRATLERFGRIDSCFANAGFGVSRRFLEMSLEDWNAVLAVNLTGVFLCFREAARHMVARGGGGKLVATSSIGAVQGMPHEPNYAASKAGVGALVRSAAVALARHDIQVNCIQPGWIETDAMADARANEKLDRTIITRTPARRWGKPEDLEGVAVYLASAASRFQTGETITLDGGYLVF